MNPKIDKYLSELQLKNIEKIYICSMKMEGMVFSFRLDSAACGLKNFTLLIAEKGDKRHIISCTDKDGRLSADLTELTTAVGNEENGAAAMYIGMEDASGQIYAKRMCAKDLLYADGKNLSPSMLAYGAERHLPPFGEKKSKDVTMCKQIYMKKDTLELYVKNSELSAALKLAEEKYKIVYDKYRGNQKLMLSFVLTVDGDAEALKETFADLMAQTLSFDKNMELILCDRCLNEECTVLSKEFAETHSKNTQYISMPGADDMATKNEGLSKATGKYIMFLRSGNGFEPNAAEMILEGVEMHYQACDMAIMPIDFRGVKTGKFFYDATVSGIRRYDLDADVFPMHCYLFATCIRRDVAQRFKFEATEAAGGDILYFMKIALEKGKISMNSNGLCYYYAFTKDKNPVMSGYFDEEAWYTDYFENISGRLYDYCMDKWNCFPEFVQRFLTGELAERVSCQTIPETVDAEAYKKCVKSLLQKIDDNFIVENKTARIDWIRMLLLRIKYDKEIELSYEWKDALMKVGPCRAIDASHMNILMNYIHLKNGRLSFEGMAETPNNVSQENTELFLYVGKKLLKCDKTTRDTDNESYFGTVKAELPFYVEVKLQDIEPGSQIYFMLCVDGHMIRYKHLSFRPTCPFTNFTENYYYYGENYVLIKQSRAFVLEKCDSLEERMKFEEQFMLSLQNKIENLPENDERKAVDLQKVKTLRANAIKYKMNPSAKKVWLVSDRITVGNDNGEAFFEYMQKKQKDRHRAVYFVLENSSVDYKRLTKMGPVLEPLSEEHLYNHLIAAWVVSSQANNPVLYPFGKEQFLYCDLCTDYKFVFLQHGVTKDDQSAWLNRFNRNMEGFVTSTRPEYNSVFEYPYYHSADNVWLTGMPRFDAMYDDDKKFITIAPTWRKSLTKGLDPETSEWLVVDDFTSSEYFKFYNALLNDKKLIDTAEKLGYTICFKPHPNTLKALDDFDRDDRVQFWDSTKSYRSMYAESSLMVTDYSSVVFDFAQMKKPVVYCQFDAEDFFSGAHTYTAGYYEYERDGFGEVEYTLEGTVNRIIEYMEGQCKLKPEYEKRINDTFPYIDKDNSKRVYEKMMEH